MITDDYKTQLRTLHDARPRGKPWGTTGARNAGRDVVALIQKRGYETILDFGCGQGTLGDYIRSQLPSVDVVGYDPGIDGKDRLPACDFDLIVSTDVLEHIEPEQLDGVLDWMRGHARQAMFHHIACEECGLILPDGRNAHLIVEPPSWWLKKLDVPGWTLMRSADILERKRGQLRRACQIQVDRRM